MTRTLEDVKFEVEISEEKHFGVNIDDIITTFEELLMMDEYLPEVYRPHFRKPEVLQSNAMHLMANLMAFSFIIALRRANGMPLPTNLTKEKVDDILENNETGECLEHGNDPDHFSACDRCGYLECLLCNPYGCMCYTR